MPKPSPIRPTDDAARSLARTLLDEASIAALAVNEPGSGWPSVSRIAMATDMSGAPMTLISSLSAHTVALRADLRCSLLVGQTPGKGDPLAFPRMTVTAEAHFVPRSDPAHPELRSRYLEQQPKAALYVDFTDFSFVRFDIIRAALNGGFGQAYELTPEDLRA